MAAWWYPKCCALTWAALRCWRPEFPARIAGFDTNAGEVAEWSNVPDSKSGVVAISPWVRIPPSTASIHIRRARVARFAFLPAGLPILRLCDWQDHCGGYSCRHFRAQRDVTAQITLALCRTLFRCLHGLFGRLLSFFHFELFLKFSISSLDNFRFGFLSLNFCLQRDNLCILPFFSQGKIVVSRDSCHSYIPIWSW